MNEQSNQTGAIESITGHEPPRADEYPLYYKVGDPVSQTYPKTVTAIRRTVENRGDHGIGWFNIYTEDGIRAIVNERAVAHVVFGDDPVAVAGDLC